MKKIRSIIVFLILCPIPVFAFSLFSTTLGATIKYIVSAIGLLVPVLFSLAFIVFFWGLSKFILHSDSHENIEKGKSYMLWGILALFILLTFRTITSFIASDLGFGPASAIPYLKGGP